MRLRARLGLVAVVLSASLAVPSVAHAHDVDGGVVATNYRSEIVRLDPDPGGIEVTRVGEGDLHLRVAPGHVVVVHGYGRAGIPPEPYLRVDEDGSVHVNLNSPAVWLNEDRSGQADLPADLDPAADPAWAERLPGGVHVARWRDHRTRWMAAAPPEWVRDDPTSRHHISDWEVPLTVDGEPVVIHGTLEWIPDRSPWPGIATVLVVVALTAAAGRRWPAAVPVTAMLAAGGALAVGGGLWVHPETQLRVTALALPAVALVAATASLSGSRLRYVATVVAGALVVAWAVPLAAVVVRPVVFSALPSELLRVLVPAAAGTSVGAVISVLTAAAAAGADTARHEVGRIGRPR